MKVVRGTSELSSLERGMEWDNDLRSEKTSCEIGCIKRMVLNPLNEYSAMIATHTLRDDESPHSIRESNFKNTPSYYDRHSYMR